MELTSGRGDACVALFAGAEGDAGVAPTGPGLSDRRGRHLQPALRAAVSRREQVVAARGAMRVAVGTELGAVARAEEQQEDRRAERGEHHAQTRGDAEHRAETDEATRPAGDD